MTVATVHRVEGTVRTYAWGSRTALAELTGRPLPTDHPEAEMWFGAHPAAACRLDGTDGSLADAIAADPDGQLGPHRDGDRLPFLLKLLAADQALSLQAHPTKEQAEEGFDRENREGVPLTASNRNYKDDNHKPELLVALTRFEALTGFRPLERSRRLLAVLDVPELARTTAVLGGADADEDLRALVTTWITLPESAKAPLVDAVAAACRGLPARAGAGDTAVEEWMLGAAEVAAGLAAQYPGDSGVLISLLLNHVVLEPGEAVFLSAGQLHAYLHGTGVEIMANSDNVLRGGLTTKHVDVPELMRVVDFSQLADPVRHADATGFYEVPVRDFTLRRCEEGRAVEVSGPAVVLATRTGVELAGDGVDGGVPEILRPGQAAWVPAACPPVSVTALGQGFIATAG
nr:mannose-6-phosphate isomerase, class I [Corynebacterium nuruki]